jgi:hypothetical protein
VDKGYERVMSNGLALVKVPPIPPHPCISETHGLTPYDIRYICLDGCGGVGGNCNVVGTA